MRMPWATTQMPGAAHNSKMACVNHQQLTIISWDLWRGLTAGATLLAVLPKHIVRFIAVGECACVCAAEYLHQAVAFYSAAMC